jgi:hypothetical protein
MEYPEKPTWERFVCLAETEPDLELARDYVEMAETAMFFRASDLVHSPNGCEESEALHCAADRLLRVKNERLKWPEPHFEQARQA